MTRGGPLVAVLFNVIALSALFIGNIGKQLNPCNNTYNSVSDAPSLEEGIPVDDDDVVLKRSTAGISTAIKSRSTDGNNNDDNELVPSYLHWKLPSPKPENWQVNVNTQSVNCKNYNTTKQYTDPNQKIIVHFHMQHNAGTEFYAFAKGYTPCATRACWQEAKHCIVSYNEEVEAENIRSNYKNYGLQYISYELQLPPHFPLPFVSETARKGLFFTTIVRDPFKRFLTAYRRVSAKEKENGRDKTNSHFFKDFESDQGPYSADNLNVRWMSGATEERISRDQVNIAKCRLQLFDLVIADKLFDHAVKKVICPLNNWKGGMFCDRPVSKEEHKSNKSDPLKEGVDPILIGGWIERLRPSFELYDYARLLSWKQLKERGIEDLPELSYMPSHLDTLMRYTNTTIISKDNENRHFNKKIKRITLENIDHFHPPVEFCNKMKQIWMSNPDEIPGVFGIGAIGGTHPTVEKGEKKQE